MFAAIRERLVGAWVKLRQGSLAKLFVFEFVVVMLGVLAAQAVAEWAGNRAEYRKMEEARARANLEYGDLLATFEIWNIALPCFRERLSEISQAAAKGDAIDPERLSRPSFFTPAVIPMSEETMLLIRQHHGDDLTYLYERLDEIAADTSRYVERLGEEWSQAELINPAYGAPSDANRAKVREMSIAALGTLRQIEMSAEAAHRYGGRLGVTPAIIGETGRPARDCAEIWREGRVYINENSPF